MNAGFAGGAAFLGNSNPWAFLHFVESAQKLSTIQSDGENARWSHQFRLGVVCSGDNGDEGTTCCNPHGCSLFLVPTGQKLSPLPMKMGTRLKQQAVFIYKFQSTEFHETAHG
jgi:hypothetical protein